METLKKIVKISMLEKHFGSLRGLPVTQPVIVEKMERAKVAPAFYFDHPLSEVIPKKIPHTGDKASLDRCG